MEYHHFQWETSSNGCDFFRCHVRFLSDRGDLDHFYKKVPDSSIFSSLASFQEHLLFRPAERERERGNSQVFFVHTGLVRQQIWVFFGFDKDLGDDQGRVLTVLVLHLALAVLLLALAFEWHDRCQMLGSMNLDCLSCVICIHLWSPYCLEKISQRHPYI